MGGVLKRIASPPLEAKVLLAAFHQRSRNGGGTIGCQVMVWQRLVKHMTSALHC